MSAANAVLKTARLTLEPMLASHAADLFAGLSEEGLYTYLPRVAPASLDALQARCKRLESRSSPEGDEWWLNWVIRIGEAGPLVGVVEATVDEDNVATLGAFVFGSAQRQHNALEAIACVREHLAGPFMAEAFVLHLDTRNLAAIGLAEKLAFKREKTIKDADNFKGHKSDQHVYRYVPPGVVVPEAPKKKSGKK